MKPATREWVRCAEEDFDVAAALLRRRTRTAANSIGFHAQQCVEKYLKARRAEAGMNVPAALPDGSNRTRIDSVACRNASRRGRLITLCK